MLKIRFIRTSSDDRMCVMVDEGGDGGGGTEEWCDGREGKRLLFPTNKLASCNVQNGGGILLLLLHARGDRTANQGIGSRPS